MARKKQHPSEPQKWGDAPSYYAPHREEFCSRSSWGRHPSSANWINQKHDGDYGPANRQGYDRADHPGDD